MLAFNSSNAPTTANIEIDAKTGKLTALHGACAMKPTAPGSLALSLAPFDYMICAGAAAP